MAYHVELKGVPLSSQQSDIAAYVIQGSVSIETAVAERPTAALSVRVPPGVTLAPKDFDELTIDYPALPYRAWSERHANLVAYWRLDEAASVLAVDSKGATPLTYGGASDLRYRAFRQETSAVPYGGAPEWAHTSGSGLSGTLPTFGQVFTVAGFLRLKAGATGNRYVWRSNTFRRSLRVGTGGSINATLDGLSVTAGVGTLSDDTWHHVAVVRTAARIGLWVDGVEIGNDTPGAVTPIESRPWQMALAISNAAVDLAMDEWGLWSEALDIAALYARQNHHRAFGGYVYGVVDSTDLGPADQHVLDLSLAGYGLRLDHSYVRQIYASPSGSTVREIVQSVLELAGLDAVFTSHGVELDDVITRAVYPVQSVMTILRELADLHGAIVTVDEWREIDLVRRTNLEPSSLVLSGGRTGNCRSIGRSTEPRFFANRAVVVGRGERGVVEDERTGDGVTRSFDSSQPIGDILSITEDGVEQTFDGTDPRWEIDVDQQRFVLVTGKGATPSGDTIKFGYVSAEAMVVTADNATAITDIGFPIARRYEDDTIDDVGLARTLATARLDRHDQRFEEFIAETIPGAVKRLRPGVAPTWNFPRQGLSSVRLLVESVSERTAAGGGAFHPVVLTIRGTAQDYQGDAGDDWRATTAYRPPAPRPAVPSTADPLQSIISPANVAVSTAIPIHLGGSVASAVVTPDWGTPDGAILTRVSGHEIAFPLALSFMARCRPRGGLAAGQAVEFRLWDATTSQAIGSSISINTITQGGERGVLRAITLPLREFDLIYQCRVLNSLRAATVWGVVLHLDM